MTDTIIEQAQHLLEQYLDASFFIGDDVKPLIYSIIRARGLNRDTFHGVVKACIQTAYNMGQASNDKDIKAGDRLLKEINEEETH
jgi:hypothetical protein